MPTETDYINAKISIAAAMNDSAIIEKLIHQDITSKQKQVMADGEKYYSYEHAVQKKAFNKSTIYSEENGIETEEIFENPNSSNHHTVNPFHRILVDQKASYIVGKEPTISVKGAGAEGAENRLTAYEEMLRTAADEDFNDLLNDWVVGASNKGYEAIHFYYDDSGDLQYCIVPAHEIIPIYDTKYQTELVELVRYYNIEEFGENGRECRKRVEWWTKTDVTYFQEVKKNVFIIDNSKGECPLPHWWNKISIDDMEKKREGQSWGRVPFILLENNSKQSTDLQAIKGLIDAYDLLSSQGTNNLLDLTELYWKLVGYGGEYTQSIIKKLQINKVVNVDGAGGDISAEQVELPVSARKEWLDMLRRDIYHFGQGVDVDTDKFGNAPSGVSLKRQYELLELKARAIIPKLKKAIKEFFWFITEDYNRRNNTDYDYNLIQIAINKSIIRDDLETSNIIRNLQGFVSDKTLLGLLSFVEDTNEELRLVAEQKEAELKAHL